MSFEYGKLKTQTCPVSDDMYFADVREQYHF